MSMAWRLPGCLRIVLLVCSVRLNAKADEWLPPGWQAVPDKRGSGRLYYWDTATNRCGTPLSIDRHEDSISTMHSRSAADVSRTISCWSLGGWCR